MSKSAAAPRFGLVEAGGTKFVLGVTSGLDQPIVTDRIATTTPDQTIAAMLDWLGRHGPFAAIGLASFGPVELDPASPHWGHILATPKRGWAQTDLAGPLAARFGCPVGFDTDVNAAVLAEWRWGAGQGQRAMAYLTIGTGIGGGAVIDGQILRGLSHPEMGHMRVARHPDDTGFAGTCPFHGPCLEGLASGPAIIARYGCPLSDLPTEHPGHDLIAWYLAQAATNLQALFEPGRIVLGGGVMETPGLLARVIAKAGVLGGGYFRGQAEAVLCAPGFGTRSGLYGALALAQGALAADAG